MTIENWLTLAGIVFSGIIGYFIKYHLDKKSQFSSNNAEIKRKAYKEYVDFMLEFLDKAQNQGGNIPQPQQEKLIKEMKKFHRNAVLYSSPRVINAYSDMLQNSYKGAYDSYFTMVFMTNVFKEMRKDIGLSNKGLRSGAIRLMRPLINDYDTTIKSHELGLISNARISLSNNKIKKA